MEILTEIIEILTGGIVAVGESMGTGLSSLAQNIFLVTGEGGVQTLSTMGTLIVIFAGIGLALGLFRWALNFVGSLGARNR